MIEYKHNFGHCEGNRMFKNIENLKIESIYKGTSIIRSSVNNRKDHCFIFRTSGCVRYTFSDKTIDVHQGEIIFLPHGSSYDRVNLTDSPCEYISIRFSADLAEAVPSSYPLDGFHESDEFMNNLQDLWKFGGQPEHYRCYSIFFNLLAYLESLKAQIYMDKNKLSIISPAVSYLKTHIYDCNLRAETLHQICGISGTYFRKIFQSNYAVSPQKYILGKRLSHAKTIIENGDFDTVSEVAISVGYSDPLYFSRAFKKKYGVSPSQYAKE